MPINREKLRPASLTQLNDELRNGILELYVLNNSGNVRNMQDSLVLVQVPIDATDRRMIRVPSTWVPVNIGMQIPKEKILAAPDFMSAINRRVLLPLLTKDAEDIFHDPDARAEADRISQDMNDTGRYAEPELVMGENSEDAIDPELNLRMVETLTRDDMDEAAEYGIIRGLTENNTLKNKDFEYILANSKYDKVRALATNQLQRK